MPKKYEALFEILQRQILEGRFAHERRLPSETELALRHKVSRPTAARALKELQALGIITRRAGSGSYLKPPSKPKLHTAPARTFALLVPGLGSTEILDPICNEITRFAQSMNCAVLWGDAEHPIRRGADALHLCRRYIDQRIDGVFFAPMESVPEREQWNRKVADALSAAGIPLVLLDRDLLEYPGRSACDLVGIDNFRAAIAITTHLIESGGRRICFFAPQEYPSTTDLRATGCREAVRLAKDASFCEAYGDPGDASALGALLRRERPDSFLCANDQTAALLLRTLQARGVDVPGAVRLAGFDDVRYAKLLAVPLTTIRQPCREIARAATLALLNRCDTPALPPQEILLPYELVVRGVLRRSGTD